LHRRSPLPCQISPHRCNDKGIGPPKLKFVVRFDQNMEYKRPTGAYPFRDLPKICRVCTPYHDALAVKTSLYLLKGLWSYGGFKLTVSGYPQIFSSPIGETMHHTPKRFGGARTCSRSSITLPCLVVLGFQTAARAAKNFEFLPVCLSVCLFVTLLNVRDCSPAFAIKALEYRNDFDAVG